MLPKILDIKLSLSIVNYVYFFNFKSAHFQIQTNNENEALQETIEHQFGYKKHNA
jgi:hypothetical protein